MLIQKPTFAGSANALEGRSDLRAQLSAYLSISVLCSELDLAIPHYLVNSMILFKVLLCIMFACFHGKA